MRNSARFAAARAAWRNFKKLVKSTAFLPLGDVPAYYRLIVGDDRPLISVRVKALDGSAVFARPGTEDHATLASVFRDQYHLPPARLPDAPVILDLGCNCGYTVVHYKTLYPDARVIGVELDEGNLAVAKRNAYRLAGVELFHAAVSHREGAVAYNALAKEDAYRVDPPPHGEPFAMKTVSAISVQSLLRQCGVGRVDFAKIDIEGEEVPLFDEAHGLGWLDAVQSLNVEVHAASPVLNRLLATLERRGFRAWKDTRHWSAIMAVRQADGF